MNEKGIRLTTLVLVAWGIASCKTDNAPSREARDAGAVDAAATRRAAGLGTCSDYYDQLMQPSSRLWTAGVRIDVEPGSWGELVDELQVLPDDAELCGVYYVGMEGNEPSRETGAPFVVTVRSSLFGEPLRDFYEPLMAEAGCSLQQDDIGPTRTMLIWECPPEKGGFLAIVNDGTGDFYSISGTIP